MWVWDHRSTRRLRSPLPRAWAGGWEPVPGAGGWYSCAATTGKTGTCDCREKRVGGRPWRLRLENGRRCPERARSISASHRMGVATHGEREPTNDRRYESNDSREMLKGSLSLMRLLCVVLLVVLRDELVCPQKLLRSSPGDGGRQTPESLISVQRRLLSYYARIEASHNPTYHSVCTLCSASRPDQLTLAGLWHSRASQRHRRPGEHSRPACETGCG